MEAVGVKGLIRQQLVMYIHAVTRVTTMYTEWLCYTRKENCWSVSRYWLR